MERGRESRDKKERKRTKSRPNRRGHATTLLASGSSRHHKRGRSRFGAPILFFFAEAGSSWSKALMSSAWSGPVCRPVFTLLFFFLSFSSSLSLSLRKQNHCYAIKEKNPSLPFPSSSDMQVLLFPFVAWRRDVDEDDACPEEKKRKKKKRRRRETKGAPEIFIYGLLGRKNYSCVL